MSEHTPGPWTATFDGNHAIIRRGEETDWACETIAKLNIYRETTEANAHLIAAAPDLLEALVDLEHLASVINDRQHAGMKITAPMWSMLYQHSAKAKAAIAKAQPQGRE